VQALVHSLALASSTILDGADTLADADSAVSDGSTTVSVPDCTVSDVWSRMMPSSLAMAFTDLKSTPEEIIDISDRLDFAFHGMAYILATADSSLFTIPMPMPLSATHNDVNHVSASPSSSSSLHNLSITLNNNTNPLITSSWPTNTPLTASLPILLNTDAVFALSAPLVSSTQATTAAQLLPHLITASAHSEASLRHLHHQQQSAVRKNSELASPVSEEGEYITSVTASASASTSDVEVTSDAIADTLATVEDSSEQQHISSPHLNTNTNTSLSDSTASTPTPCLIPPLAALGWVYLSSLLHDSQSVDLKSYAADGVQLILEETGKINTNMNKVGESDGQPQTSAPSPTKLRDVNHSPFGLKADLVQALGNIAHLGGVSAQSTLGSLGCVEMALSNSVLDEHNPFVREWAVMAVRSLTEGTHSNQCRVRAMADQGKANKTKLEAVGAEAWDLDQQNTGITGGIEENDAGGAQDSPFNDYDGSFNGLNLTTGYESQDTGTTGTGAGTSAQSEEVTEILQELKEKEATFHTAQL
jgi:hypothetical protein